jgi:hypothetical protein
LSPVYFACQDTHGASLLTAEKTNLSLLSVSLFIYLFSLSLSLTVCHSLSTYFTMSEGLFTRL